MAAPEAAGAQPPPGLSHGDDGTGQPATPEPAAGQPVVGQPVAGQPPTVAPPAGSLSTAVPGRDHAGADQSRPDHAGSGHPGSGHPGSGHPGSGHPGSGHPGSGHPGSGQAGRDQARARTLWWAVAVLTAVVALLLVFDGLWYARYRTEEQVVSRNFPVHRGTARSISDDASGQLLAAAKQAAARYLSYNYAHIQQDKAAAASVMTGSFRDQYTESMEMTIIPVARQVKAVVVGQTLTAGVSSINDDATQGVVIAFVNETVTNTKIRGSRVDLVRLRLTMDKVSDDWLISKVESI